MAKAQGHTHGPPTQHTPHRTEHGTDGAVGARTGQKECATHCPLAFIQTVVAVALFVVCQGLGDLETLFKKLALSLHNRAKSPTSVSGAPSPRSVKTL